jgi:hypothetical protein
VVSSVKARETALLVNLVLFFTQTTIIPYYLFLSNNRNFRGGLLKNPESANPSPTCPDKALTPP